MKLRVYEAAVTAAIWLLFDCNSASNGSWIEVES